MPGEENPGRYGHQASKPGERVSGVEPPGLCSPMRQVAPELKEVCTVGSAGQARAGLLQCCIPSRSDFGRVRFRQGRFSSAQADNRRGCAQKSVPSLASAPRWIGPMRRRYRRDASSASKNFRAAGAVGDLHMFSSPCSSCYGLYSLYTDDISIRRRCEHVNRAAWPPGARVSSAGGRVANARPA